MLLGSVLALKVLNQSKLLLKRGNQNKHRVGAFTVIPLGGFWKRSPRNRIIPKNHSEVTCTINGHASISACTHISVLKALAMREYSLNTQEKM